MDSERCKDSGEVYSPDDQGEYTPLDEVPAEEYAMMLEVMTADHPGRPHPPMFSWNIGMVMHILKSDPVLRELEHMQVDGLGSAYLFFYDKQGHRGLSQDTAHVIRAHMEEDFQSGFCTQPILPLASFL